MIALQHNDYTFREVEHQIEMGLVYVLYLYYTKCSIEVPVQNTPQFVLYSTGTSLKVTEG